MDGDRLENIDNAIDAAAKELMTDAPVELLTRVMYAVEKDAAPKRRFAFGRFTTIAAAAAAVVFLVTILPQSTPSTDNTNGLRLTDSGGAEQGTGVAPEAEMATIQGKTVYGINEDAADEAMAFMEPFRLQISPAEQALYDYLDKMKLNVYSITWESDTVAAMEVEDGMLRVSVVEKDGLFEITEINE